MPFAMLYAMVQAKQEGGGCGRQHTPFVDEVERSDAKSPAPLAATTSGNSHVSSAYSDTLPSNPAVTNTPGVRGLQSTLKFQLPLCGSSASTSKSDEVSHTMVLQPVDGKPHALTLACHSA